MDRVKKGRKEVVITPEQKAEIFKLYNMGVKIYKIAEKVNLSKYLIMKVLHGEI